MRFVFINTVPVIFGTPQSDTADLATLAETVRTRKPQDVYFFGIEATPSLGEFLQSDLMRGKRLTFRGNPSVRAVQEGGVHHESQRQMIDAVRALGADIWISESPHLGCSRLTKGMKIKSPAARALVVASADRDGLFMALMACERNYPGQQNDDDVMSNGIDTQSKESLTADGWMIFRAFSAAEKISLKSPARGKKIREELAELFCELIHGYAWDIKVEGVISRIEAEVEAG